MELLGVLEIRAPLAQQYVEIGDRAGLLYATRCLQAELHAVVETTRQLIDQDGEQ